MSDPGFSLFTSLRYDVVLKQVPARTDLGHVAWNRDNESSLYMLDLHRDRLVRAARHWHWQQAVDGLAGDDGLRRLARAAEEAAGASETKPLRLRILVDREGGLRVERFDTAPLPLENLLPRRLTPPGLPAGPGEPGVPPVCALVVDDAVTASSDFTHFKTTRRAVYDAARQRAVIGPRDPSEVLLVNDRDRSVMEGSITTPYFWRNGRWTTPPVSPRCGGQAGSGGQDGTSRRWALERALAVEETVLVDSLADGEECWISNGVSGFRRAVVQLSKAPS